MTTATGRLFKTQIAGGTHRIEGKKEGFVTWAKDIDVTAESEQRLPSRCCPHRILAGAHCASQWSPDDGDGERRPRRGAGRRRRLHAA